MSGDNVNQVETDSFELLRVVLSLKPTKQILALQGLVKIFIAQEKFDKAMGFANQIEDPKILEEITTSIIRARENFLSRRPAPL